MSLAAVLFDVDFTLAKPGPDLGPEGYTRLGARHGLELDASRYDEARHAAFDTLELHPELEHDEEVWVLFTERIIRGMGGDSERAYECAVEMTRAWEHAHNFDLYDDVLPDARVAALARAEARARSRTPRATSTRSSPTTRSTSTRRSSSRAHGKVKPHESIFLAVLELLGVARGGDGDGRRHADRRRRGCASAGDPRVPARPRGPVPRRATLG